MPLCNRTVKYGSMEPIRLIDYRNWKPNAELNTIYAELSIECRIIISLIDKKL